MYPVRPRIGYAAFWEKVPDRQWPGTVRNLREGLEKVADVVDIGVWPSNLTRVALKGMSTRYRHGRLTNNYGQSRLAHAYMTQGLKRGLKKNFKDARCDAVLMIDCIASVPEPFFIYVHNSRDSLIALDAPARMSSLRSGALQDMQQHRGMQEAIFERATGIFAESDRWARSLIEHSGVSRDKIHVVPPALAGGRGRQERAPLRIRQAPRRKLLYVDHQYDRQCFNRAEDDLLLDALEVLRREYDPQITLTVAGMEKWPLRGSLPAGVSFLGILPAGEMARLLDSHDLCVVPAAGEPYSLIFAEALSRGMPCVAHDTGAMLEIIIPGVSGAVFDKDDPYALASAIVSVLTDGEIYQKCYERAPAMAAYFSWERVARQITRVISREIGVSS